ncbi:MAG: polysaccharide biosynthesis/export family protein [Desulfobacteraceae bacterium]
MIQKTAVLIGIVFLILSAGILPADSAEYTVGDGDILKIKVYENEDLSKTVRVTSNDTIRVPLLGEVSVAGLTVSEVSFKLQELLDDGYLVNPQVDVFIEEYRSKNAIILGQINRPGQYELRGAITFLEFVSKAGGLTDEAGSTATVKRVDPSENGKDTILINLDRLIKKGDTSLNIPIKDKDNIYISKADVFYVSGEVDEPDSYKLESDMTVIKGITKAGGFTNIAAENKVKIIRLQNGEKQVMEKVKMDELIKPGDVIVVPESFF